MKNKSMIMLALFAMTAGVAVHAEDTHVAATEAVESKLSADELSFAAKLNDQNRKSFAEKLSAEQRKSVQIAVKHGANADEAVQKMLAATALKEASAIANAETAAEAAAQ